MNSWSGEFASVIVQGSGAHLPIGRSKCASTAAWNDPGLFGKTGHFRLAIRYPGALLPRRPPFASRGQLELGQRAAVEPTVTYGGYAISLSEVRILLGRP